MNPFLGTLHHARMRSNRFSPSIITTLHPSNTHHLKHLPPKPDRWIQETRLISIDERSFPDKIHLTRPDKSGAFEDLPDNEETGNNDLHGVVGPEIFERPGLENGVAVEDGYEEHPDERDVGAVRLEPAVVCELASVNTLDFAGAVVADEGDTDGDVVDKTCFAFVNIGMVWLFLGHFLPPAVTRLENQVMTTDELLEHCRKERIGKIITMPKQ